MKYRQEQFFILLSLVFVLVTPAIADAQKSQTPPAGHPAVHKAKKTSFDASASVVEMNAVDNVLSSHNIVLFIDQSQSMGKADCPDGLSRWDWCAEQSGDLARRLAPLTHDNLTIVPFSTTFSVHRNCTVDMVRELFTKERPNGNTNLLDPLVDQLATYIANPGPSRRPLVIAIITDGRPAHEGDIFDAIINAANHLHDAHEVSIVFLQVGQAFNGRHFLNELDNDLVSHGAKYDIVSVRNFDDLEKKGLAQSLGSAILEVEKPDKQTH